MFDYYHKIILTILLVYVIIVKSVTPSVIKNNNSDDDKVNNKKQDTYESWISDQGLYDANDEVTILNVTNFKSTIYGKKNVWIVEFYNSWCGHCQRFAPIWKSVARSIVGWKDVVQVAAIDCSNDDNNALCREYKIVFYPVIRYFPPNAKSDIIGEDIDKGNSEESMRHKIVEKLQKEQIAGRGLESWSNISPYKISELQDIWKNTADNILYKFYVCEENNSFLGPEVILDLRNITNIQIRRITSDQWLCMIYKVTTFPSLVVFNRKGNQSRLKIPMPTRIGVAQVIEEYLKSNGIIINAKEINEPIIHDKYEATKKNQTSSMVKSVGDVLYQSDLDSALKYSLEREIPLVKQIDGLRMKALKEYLRALVLYFPMKHGSQTYLPHIRNAIENKTSISGEDFRELVKSTEQRKYPVYSSKQQQWVGCKGSFPKLRGYPCGLWMLFHTMTVNYAAVDEEDTPVDTPERILSVMHGYIKNFFGCSDCAEHFVDMAEKQKLFDVESTDEAVLWLWRAHNQVNSRLHGDITEDPEFPKIQYPSRKDCSDCRNDDGTWNEVQVFSYLKKKYSDVHYDVEAVSQLRLDTDDLMTRKNTTDQHKVGWDFTIFDISICVIIYVVSATILVLVCIKFVVKRSSKKKLLIQNLLGRV